MARTHFYTFEREDETEVSVEYSITPYDPGVSSGPAEICYPPEGGEVEILQVFSETLESVVLTDAEERDLPSTIFEQHEFDDDREYYED
jgi:hypothetical protein